MRNLAKRITALEATVDPAAVMRRRLDALSDDDLVRLEQLIAEHDKGEWDGLTVLAATDRRLIEKVLVDA